jgi:hypothetical protein
VTRPNLKNEYQSPSLQHGDQLRGCYTVAGVVMSVKWMSVRAKALADSRSQEAHEKELAARIARITYENTFDMVSAQ